MAFLDASLNFSQAQAITVTAASTNLYDITSAGSGNAPAMNGANGVNTDLGGDIFAGDGQAIPQVFVNVNVTGTTTNTITINIQSAPDNGSYSPGTWTTIGSSGAIVADTLIAGDALIINGNPLPPHIPLPRFYRLQYVCSGTLSITLTANLTINAPTNRDATLYGSNFAFSPT
jgi:hypothetical protein